jgi:hypothetical protein
MAFLITHHDPGHVHTILGMICLLHFAYRIALIIVIGTAFPTSERSWVAAGCVALHGLLSWSSLLLQLPHKRNFKKPMIWHEFRLHSILFASRHVACTLVTLLAIGDRVTFSANIVGRTAIVVGVSFTARIITQRHGNRETRTTNAMPYPASIVGEQQKAIKYNYMQAQFHATAHAVMGNATSAFLPLLGIQGAAFLMTLVRKGIMKSIWYHRVYSLLLYIPYLAMLAQFVHGTISKSTILWYAGVTGFFIMRLRTRLGWPPELVWAVSAPLLMVGNECLHKYVLPCVLQHIPDVVGHTGTLVYALYVLFGDTLRRYHPLVGLGG